jgi:putative DNA primase/helicase
MSIITVRSIATRFNLRRVGNTWRGQCPVCRYDATSLSMFEIAERIYVQCHAGCSYHDVRRALFSDMSLNPRDENPETIRRHRDAIQRKRDWALRFWLRSASVLNTVAHGYLSMRGLDHLALSPVLRFHQRATHPDHPGYEFPALIARIDGPNGELAAIQKTFLDTNGRKANVEVVRVCIGEVRGGAIRLGKPDPHLPLVIGEGLETTGSAAQMIAAKLGLSAPLPAWAAVNARNLARGVVLPAHVHTVVIGADPDAAGRAAAYEAWSRWTAEARQVQVALPGGHHDFNDMSMGAGRG